MSINKPMKGQRYSNSPLKELRKKLGLVPQEFTYLQFKGACNKAKVFGDYDHGQLMGFLDRALQLNLIELIESPDDPEQTRYKKLGSFRPRKKA